MGEHIDSHAGRTPYEADGYRRNHTLSFNIQPAGTSGFVSILVRIVPLPAEASNYDKTWDFQTALRGTLEPMMARHIGQRLIDQAKLAEATAQPSEDAPSDVEA